MPEGTKRDREEVDAKEASKTQSGAANGEPEPKKQETSSPEEVVEDGKIYFLYRPRVGFKEAKSLSDVQRFFLVLAPEKGKKRLIPIGKKKVPAQKERFFGFVQTVSENVEDLTGGMGKNTYETATSGTRTNEAARIAAEGRYSIVAKEGQQTHLAWKLEIPKELGDVQKELCIGQEGSLVLSIKNPKKKDPPQRNVGLDTKAEFGEKQKLFEGTPGGYAWISARDPSLLDFQNAELLFIGASSDIKDTVGKNIEEHLESKTEKDVKEAGAEDANQEEEEEKLVQEMKNELAADKPGLETAPIEEKEWK